MHNVHRGQLQQAEAELEEARKYILQQESTSRPLESDQELQQKL